MKKIFTLCLLAFIGVTTASAQTWQTVGAAGFSAGEADYTTLVFNGSTPYVAYLDAANSYKVTVKKFDGIDWVTVGFSAGGGR